MRVLRGWLRIAFFWAIPTIAFVVLWHPITTLLGSGAPGNVLGLLFVWLTLIPLGRAAADLSTDLLRRGA